LTRWQQDIDDAATYTQRVALAKSKFSSRNTTRNKTFQEVRAALTKMCSGNRRCSYCEDSVADEVEHIRPKDLYPEQVFVWENYCYACGRCNGPKSNHFAVFPTAVGAAVNVTRPRNGPVTPPVAGEPALIDPRIENPMDLLFVDLAGTFQYLPNVDLVSRDQQKAEYTIELLRLNRDILIRGRRTARIAFEDILARYIEKRDANAPQEELDRRVATVRELYHRTVWFEMIRQRPHYADLELLFDQAPEALEWI